MISWMKYIKGKFSPPWSPEISVDCVTGVKIEVDPYWEDIIDETNRRLYENEK